jgi:biotin synthase
LLNQQIMGFFFVKIMSDLNALVEKVIGGYQVGKDEAMSLLDVVPKQKLYDAANKIRERCCGEKAEFCSISNVRSGHCPENCKWCSQSVTAAADIRVYGIIEDDILLKEALTSAEKGVERHSLVSSGRRVSDQFLDKLEPACKAIRQKSDIKLCASMGLVTRKQLKRLRDDFGVERYHCNLETAPSFFKQVCTSHSVEDKFTVIKNARELGMQVCSGGILGMGETAGQRVELALVLRDLKVDSIPLNILTPIPGTSLEKAAPLSEEEILTSIAIFRFVHPSSIIRFAGGRMQIKSFQHKALKAGINGAITGDYLTTKGSNIERDIRDFEKAGLKPVKT